MEKATIYDYARMCRSNSGCSKCPLSHHNTNKNESCISFIKHYPNKSNEVILDWCEEHPVETRQDRFLKIFPNANIYRGCLAISPCNVDIRQFDSEKCGVKNCTKCRKKYWLAEVNENE